MIRKKLQLAVLASVLVCAPVASAADRGRPLLVGGSAAPAHAWPSAAFLEGRYADSGGTEHVFHCTGSVIAPSWIITAAHCAFGNPNQPPDAMSAVLGVTDDTDPHRQVIAIDQFVPHPSYDAENHVDDVALLHLTQPTSVPVIPLATAAGNSAGDYHSQDGVPNAAGWGAIDEGGHKFTNVLQQAYLKIRSSADCGALVSGFDPNTETCAGTPGSATACFGDSGGPLVMSGANGDPVLWGVTSYRAVAANGSPCSLKVPAVYTWIPAFGDFIQRTLGGSPSPASAVAARRSPAN